MAAGPNAADRSRPATRAEGPAGAVQLSRALFGAWLVILYGGWLLAWWLFRSLGLSDPLTATAWWTAAKLVVWIAPVMVFSRLVPLPRGGLRLNHLRGFGLGCLLSIGWIAVNASGDVLPAPVLNSAVLSACFVAPFLEEVLFRGFAFSWLERFGFGFWQANLSCAVLFALLHLPGWALMEGLSLGLFGHLGQVALLGFGFGLLRKGDATLWAPIALHFANNAWSQGLITWLLAWAKS